ncbi:MAG TPA: hypothetical protein VFS16_08115 [Acidimicrobiia bacterium]|nr:hypothetical protein [Acidimicrobiia bacterium]
MRRVLVVTWALGTATGVLLGLFGVQLVSSRFSTAGVSPMSRPEVLRALQAARSVPAADEVAAPADPTPDTTAPAPSPPVDEAPVRPSAGSTSSPAPAPPASTLPRPGATAGTLVNAAAPPEPPTTTTVTVAPAAPTSTTATTKPPSKKRPETTSTTRKSTTTTTERKSAAPADTSKAGPSDRSIERTVSSQGGVVTVRWADGKVKMIVARPKAGYEMKVYDNGPDRVIVRFSSRNHTSWVAAFYRDGRPDSYVAECSGAYRDRDCR